ncbi:heparinase II/III family protein [Amycolatopsis rifamycinica]|uniref:Heparinase n=1 Tax=Amycolatopsis rifamycinica TaxID=287986 RepID=A0A066U6F5_9PSEU|nr:alginate lyase family protein [Amycolatopsis rifamycinica]KDN19664.1 heparinase [Amycolatopsis rifamycinica]
MMGPGWYLRRLSRMGPAEVVGRARHAVVQRQWRSAPPTPPDWPSHPRFTATLPAGALDKVSGEAAKRLLATADELMAGRAEYFGVERTDFEAPDWFLDPKTGRRAPSAVYAFDVPYRSEDTVGDIKQIWEPSRHQHLTVLAAAYALTGSSAYAARAAEHLRSWWAANPPLRGPHWVSGIELGIRLLSWVWTRRLLDGWPGVAELFEENPDFQLQLWHHQNWLATLRSHGSSANNHVIAEDAGLLAAACAFGWFPESAGWRAAAMRSLDVQLGRNTFDSGLNAELASEYHGLVLELGLAAAAEADAAGTPAPDSTWDVLLRMTDALASIVDQRLRPPRQGDADDGFGLIVDGTATDRWASLLASGDALFGRLDWWPPVPADDVRTPLLASLVSRTPRVSGARPGRRQAHLRDAGMTILRSGPVWVRCDGGPHGFLSIAAHAHADALSLEVRHDGVDILADPGTFCYHGEPRWRQYFRSTLGHNTLELAGRDQSVSGGPFLWTRHAVTRVLEVHTPDNGPARWSAAHDGYAPALHRRTVDLDGDVLKIVDEVLGDQPPEEARLAFHFGPSVTVMLDGTTARLRWTAAPESPLVGAPSAGRPDSSVAGAPGAGHLGSSVAGAPDAVGGEGLIGSPAGAGQPGSPVRDGGRAAGSVAAAGRVGPATGGGASAGAAGDPLVGRVSGSLAGAVRTAVMELPSELSWTVHRGDTEPPLGWYSAGFGRKEPATTLVGSGSPGLLTTLLRFS